MPADVTDLCFFVALNTIEPLNVPYGTRVNRTLEAEILNSNFLGGRLESLDMISRILYLDPFRIQYFKVRVHITKKSRQYLRNCGRKWAKNFSVKGVGCFFVGDLVILEKR